MYLPTRVGLACEGDSSIAPTADYYACTSRPYRNPSFLSAFFLEEKAPTLPTLGKCLCRQWASNSLVFPTLQFHPQPDPSTAFTRSFRRLEGRFASVRGFPIDSRNSHSIDSTLTSDMSAPAPPDPGNTVIYSTTLPVFYTAIPASIRRRIPRLYHSLYRSLGSGGENGNGNEKRHVGNESELCAKGLTSASEPQLAYSTGSIIAGFADGDAAAIAASASAACATRPGSPGSSSERSLHSVDTSTSNASEGREGTNVVTKYEIDSGLKWNRIVPG